jgi:hypothetical protein
VAPGRALRHQVAIWADARAWRRRVERRFANFSPLAPNRPSIVDVLLHNNDVVLSDRRTDPDETVNLAPIPTTTGWSTNTWTNSKPSSTQKSAQTKIRGLPKSPSCSEPHGGAATAPDQRTARPATQPEFGDSSVPDGERRILAGTWQRSTKDEYHAG